MKKRVFFLIAFGFSLMSFAQDKAMVQDLYFYINRTDFFGNSGAYRAKFAIKSEDKRFSTDNYFLRINNPLGEEKSLYSLGKRIDIKTIDYINPEDFFKDTSACETHNELSLINKGFSGIRIFIVTNIHPELLLREKDKTKKHIMWEVKYDGTIKDYSYSNLGRGPFFEKLRKNKN